MSVEYIKIKDLQPYHNNSRTHSKEQVEQVRRSIEEFGFTNPILIHGKTIIAGHCRLEAAKKLGMSSVPCLKLDHLSKDQARAYVIADNKLAMNAGWDDEVLKEEIESLIASDFEINLLGFDESELKELGIGLPSFEGSGDGDPDDIPEVPQNIHGVKRGDIWMLGDHRLMCGDSTDKADVARLMDGQKADIVFTDPPYNHASDDALISQSVSQAMKKLSESKWDKGFSIQKTLEIIDQFRRNDCSVYICTSWHLAGKIWEWSADRSSCDGYCVWHKPNPMPSLMKRHWTWASELICYATFGKHTFNFPLSGHASSVWSFNKNSKNDLHPTMKPIAIPEHAIIHSSNAGDLVLDLFLGSGSTLIACEKTGRKCYGMELDEHYCSVIIERWQQFTGKKAERIDERP